VQLSPEQVELLTVPLWEGGPTWSSRIASVAGAAVHVSLGEDAVAEIQASGSALTRAYMLLTKILEFKRKGGVEVNMNARHSFMTPLKWDAMKDYQDQKLADLAVQHKVVILPARQKGNEAKFLEIGGEVEVRKDDGKWYPARLQTDLFTGSETRVLAPSGLNLQVPVRNVRPGFDIIAIFGDQRGRAAAQLAIMHDICQARTDFNFGPGAAAALGQDGSFGTYRRIFKDPYRVFVRVCRGTDDLKLQKVLQPATGCALTFFTSAYGENKEMLCEAFAAGFVKERSCAKTLLEALWTCFSNNSVLPTAWQPEDQSWCLKFKIPRQSIPGLSERPIFNFISEEEEFQVLLMLAKDLIDPTQRLNVGETVEGFNGSRWVEARVAESKPEDEEFEIRLSAAEDGQEFLVDAKQVRAWSDTDTIFVFGCSVWRQECARLRLMAQAAASAGDGGQQILEELQTLTSSATGIETEFVDPPGGDASICRQVAPRIGRSTNCGVEVVAGKLVLHGNSESRDRAKYLLKFASLQKGNPAAEVVVADNNFANDEVSELLHTIDLTAAEKQVVTAQIIEQVEKETGTFIFIRDDHSKQTYSHGEAIEFKWVPEGEPGEHDWHDGTFVRRCIGKADEVKISYQAKQESDDYRSEMPPKKAVAEEIVVKLKNVRPAESNVKRKPPALMIFSPQPGFNDAFGAGFAGRRIKALLRNAVGQATTGQKPSEKGKGKGGKGGKGFNKGPKPCFSFQKDGNCRRGETCPFSHDVKVEGGGQAGGGKGGSWNQDRWAQGKQESDSQRESWQNWKSSSQDGQDGNSRSRNWSDSGNGGGRSSSWGDDKWNRGQSGSWGKSWERGDSDNRRQSGSWEGSWNRGQGSSSAASASNAPAERQQEQQSYQQQAFAPQGSFAQAPPQFTMGEIAATREEAQRQNSELEVTHSHRWESLTPEDIPTNVQAWQLSQDQYFPGATPLPGGWLRVLSKKTKKMYFMNVHTMSSTYDVMMCFA